MEWDAPLQSIMNIRRKGIRTDSHDKQFKAVRSVGDDGVRIEPGARRKRARRARLKPDDTEGKWAAGDGKGGHRIRRNAFLFATAAACLAGAVIAGAVIFREPPAKGAAASFLPPPLAEGIPTGPATIGEKDAVARIQTLLASRDEAEVESLIRHGAMSARDAVAFLENFPRAAEIHWVGRIESFPVPAAALIVVPVRGPLGVVFFRPEEAGGWRIDFDAFARHTEKPLADFLSGKGGGGTFRLVAAGDRYYNGAYADEAVWACYILKSPDYPDVIYGYCRRDGAQGRAMARMEGLVKIRREKNISAFNGEGPASFRATLTLRRNPGDGSRQAEINAVVADDWLVTGTDFDKPEGVIAD